MRVGVGGGVRHDLGCKYDSFWGSCCGAPQMWEWSRRANKGGHLLSDTHLRPEASAAISGCSLRNCGV